jgi:hypothetical protein
MSISAPEGDHRPAASRLRLAKVREGTRGDWSVTLWIKTEDEAVEIAQLINDRLRRRPEAEAVEP